MNYGKMLDNYDPKKDLIYDSVDRFFNHPLMTKIKDVEKYSMYMTKTYCLLSNECRYLIAFVEKDEIEPMTTQYLRSLHWISFQTRTLEDRHDIQSHPYTAKMGGLLSDKINRVETQDYADIYHAEKLPLAITMIHKKDGSEYQEKGSIISALETYNTIVTFLT